MFAGTLRGPLLGVCLKGYRPFSLCTQLQIRTKTRLTNATAVSHGTSPVSLKLVARCGLFMLASVNAVYVGTVIWDFEHWRRQALRVKEGAKRRLKQDSGFFNSLQHHVEHLLGRPIMRTDVYWGIVLCNLVVFIGNRSPLGPIILRRFVNSPYGPTPALSMLLSVFSHYSLLHFGVNMYVLHSFSSSLISTIGPGDFLSLFVGGGIFASFMSLLSKAAHRSRIPSLGASGGICAVLGAFCMLQPHARLCVPFLVDVIPHSFEAGTTVWTLLMLEIAAAFLLAARSPIDHAAHLGGLMFGMFYGLPGTDVIWRRRTAIISWWRNLRGD